MSTKNVITGSAVTLTIDDKAGTPVDFTPQVTNVSLASDVDRQEFNLVNGGVFYKTTVRSYELTISGLADWGHADSVCDALEQAFADDPDAPLDFSMPIVGSPDTVTVTGKVFPKVPVAGGAGSTVTEFDLTLVGDVNTALVFTTTTPV